MIRRELPRTSSAGWVRKPYRIILLEGSPFRGPSAVVGAAVQQEFTKLRCRFLELCFCLNRDGPQESEQLASERRHDLILMLAASHHRGVALMQALLRFPGDVLGLVAER